MEFGSSPPQLDAKDFEDLPHLQDDDNNNNNKHTLVLRLPSNWTFSRRDVLHTSTQAPSPTGSSTSRLVSSSRWRKISRVPRQRHRTVGGDTGGKLETVQRALSSAVGEILTRLPGHSHHAPLLQPGADVVFQSQEFADELQKSGNQFERHPAS